MDESPVEILLVDDSPENLLALETVLADLGQNLVKADSGREVLRRLLERDFALILLDVQMPGMDGFETASIVRMRERNRTTPIVFLTATGTGSHDIARGYQTGAIDYILKPFDAEILRAKVSVFVELFRKTRKIERQAAQLEEANKRLETEIRERQRVEEVLCASEENLRLAVTSADLGTWSWDIVADEIRWSDRCRELFGIPEGERLNYGRFLAALHLEDRGRVDEAVRAALRDRAEYDTEFRAIWPDGSVHWIAARGRAVFDAAGGPLEMNGVVLDFTARNLAEQELIRAKEEAVRSSKFKDQFLSTMSHELRTPLNAVLGFTDLLADEMTGPLNEKQRNYANHVLTGGRHLLALVNDILDLSRIESGRVDLTLEAVPLAAAAEEVIETLRPLADRKSQKLSARVDPGLGARADLMRLKQILLNLVGNAIKYSRDGCEVELAARREGNRALLEVRDTGPGIPREEQARIFEAFYRIRRPGAEHAEGTGLGLAICVRLVALHGSELRLESEPGRGSRFYFELPAAEAAIRAGAGAGGVAGAPGTRAARGHAGGRRASPA